MTNTDTDENILDEIVRQLQEHGKARAEALRLAVEIDKGLPHPVISDWRANCPHGITTECDCPKRTAAEHAGEVRMVEEETAERVIRTAERFHAWITLADTPEKERDRALQALQDGDGSTDRKETT